MSAITLLMCVLAVRMQLALSDGYSRPVKYAGPIVYSNNKPPIVHFPKPPRVKSGYGGQRGRGGGQGKAATSVKYVPLPHHDLPVLIYQSDSQPPIHVVHTPAPPVALNRPTSSYGAPKSHLQRRLQSSTLYNNKPTSVSRAAGRVGQPSGSDTLYQYSNSIRRDGGSGGTGHSATRTASASAHSHHGSASEQPRGYSAPPPTNNQAAQSGYGSAGQRGGDAVYIKSPPAPAPVYVNVPQPIYMTASHTQTHSTRQPTSSYRSPKHTNNQQKKPQSSYQTPPTQSYSAPVKTAANNKGHFSQKPAPILSQSHGKGKGQTGSYSAPVVSSYKTPSKPKSKGTSKGSYPTSRPNASYKAPAQTKAPHVIYAGHPPIHVYQQPEIRQVPHTPTRTYGVPSTKATKAPKPTHTYKVPKKPQNNYAAPSITSTKSKYPPPISGGYRPPSKGQSSGKYPASVSTSYGQHQKSKGSDGKSKYRPLRLRQNRPAVKPAPVYLPAPKAYNKPPIIIYQGVRPPVHVYRAKTKSSPHTTTRPRQSYGTPSRSFEVQTFHSPQPGTSSLYSQQLHHHPHAQHSQTSQYTQLDNSAAAQTGLTQGLQPRYRPERRGNPAEKAQVKSASTIHHTLKGQTSAELSSQTDGFSSSDKLPTGGGDDWQPLGVPADHMVPAKAYVMEAPDLTARQRPSIDSSSETTTTPAAPSTSAVVDENSKSQDNVSNVVTT